MHSQFEDGPDEYVCGVCASSRRLAAVHFAAVPRFLFLASSACLTALCYLRLPSIESVLLEAPGRVVLLMHAFVSGRVVLSTHLLCAYRLYSLTPAEVTTRLGELAGWFSGVRRSLVGFARCRVADFAACRSCVHRTACFPFLRSRSGTLQQAHELRPRASARDRRAAACLAAGSRGPCCHPFLHVPSFIASSEPSRL
jgi:hypothetical protein